MSRDQFAPNRDEVFQPSRNAFAITPSNTAAIDPLPKALYVGSTGNITLRSIDGGADVVFTGLQAGTILPVRAQFVRLTGTTATGILALA
jgi:hypothetical protein